MQSVKVILSQIVKDCNVATVFGHPGRSTSGRAKKKTKKNTQKTAIILEKTVIFERNKFYTNGLQR